MGYCYGNGLGGVDLRKEGVARWKERKKRQKTMKDEGVSNGSERRSELRPAAGGR